MSKSRVIENADGKLKKVVEMVFDSNEPMTVRTPAGKAVKVIPIPKPIRMWKGRPVYRGEDAKYLYLDYPWLLE